jgi:hypothetical protein
MSIIDGGDCPFCLGKGGGKLREDKKGRPYFNCETCGTRAFIRTTRCFEVFKWILSNGVNYANAKLLNERSSVPSEVTNVG